MNKRKIYKDREEEKYERTVKVVIGLIFSILFLFGVVSFGYVIYWIFHYYWKMIISSVIGLGIVAIIDKICEGDEKDV